MKTNVQVRSPFPVNNFTKNKTPIATPGASSKGLKVTVSQSELQHNMDQNGVSLY